MRELWASGRPSEASVDNIRLHYYAIDTEEIKQKLRSLDDEYLYTYSTAVVARDPASIWSTVEPLLAHNPSVRTIRLEGKLDMLKRRRGVLEKCLSNQDPVTTAKVCVELVVLAAKTCALADDIQFDPRKRLFGTAMKGPLGRRARDDIRIMIGSLGNCALGRQAAEARYRASLDRVLDRLDHALSSEGLRTHLDRPDPRHTEPQ
jgi:hypothetical protein